MAGKVRFYRGEQGTSLPATRQNGAIFIIERFGSDGNGYSVGDMYVDMDNGNRLHIVPDQPFQVYTSNQSGNVSTRGSLYVEYEKDENNHNKITNAYVRVGDGNAYIGDLPVYSTRLYDAIKNKVNAYLGTEYLTQSQRDEDTGSATNKPLSDNFPKKMVDNKEVIDEQALAETLVLSRELWLDF